MKKGFTLIELLAVILVLGIIALIAVPKITNTVEDSRRKATEVSASNYMKALDDTISYYKLDNDPTNDISDGYKVVNELPKVVNVDIPQSGTVTIEKGKVQSATLLVDGYKSTCNSNRECTSKKASFIYSVEPGLIDIENEKLLVSWDELVNVYGFNILEAYSGNNAISNNNLEGFIKIPQTVKEIGSAVFRNCKKITGVYIPASVVLIGEEAFNKSSIQSAYFENQSNWYTLLKTGDKLMNVSDPTSIADKIKRTTSTRSYPLVKWVNKTNEA